MKIFKLVAACAIFVSFNLFSAEWNPDYLSLDPKAVNEVLRNRNLIKCEKKVLNFVKGSWCSEEKAKMIMDLIALTRPNVCVEIGVFSGSSTLPILAGLKYVKNGQAYVVDAWTNSDATFGLPKEDPNTIWWNSLDMNAIKDQFTQMVKKWNLEPYCQVLHMPSKTAASKIPAINFLHLDGNFSEAGALRDSTIYIPKVVSGGYILLSNALVMIDGKPTKMRALWPLFDQCEIICELEYGNTLLFRKN